MKYKNPRVHYENFDLIFSTRHPFLVFVSAPHAFEDYQLTPDQRHSRTKKYDQWDLALWSDGKKERMHNLIVNPKKGNVSEHIGGNTFDVRPVMLREATYQQNSFNKPNADRGQVVQNANGKWFVIFKPQKNASDHLFDSREEAEDYLISLIQEIYGEYDFVASQKFSREHETYMTPATGWADYVFDDEKVLKEIEKLPYVHGQSINYLKIKLRELNAEYWHLLAHIQDELQESLHNASNDEEKKQLSRIIDWLNKGHYVLNLPYFQKRFDEFISLYLKTLRHVNSSAECEAKDI